MVEKTKGEKAKRLDQLIEFKEPKSQLGNKQKILEELLKKKAIPNNKNPKYSKKPWKEGMKKKKEEPSLKDKLKKLRRKK